MRRHPYTQDPNKQTAHAGGVFWFCSELRTTTIDGRNAIGAVPELHWTKHILSPYCDTDQW
jgi:hypothetical protein